MKPLKKGCILLLACGGALSGYAQNADITIDELAMAVENYVEEESAENQGFFVVHDDEQDKDLQLKLDKVHKDKLASLGDNTYFVCADFKGSDGKLYDVDIFMDGESKNALTETETTVHKVNGKERYTWQEENGVWKRKESAKGGEHPKSKEHPKKDE